MNGIFIKEEKLDDVRTISTTQIPNIGSSKKCERFELFSLFQENAQLIKIVQRLEMFMKSKHNSSKT